MIFDSIVIVDRPLIDVIYSTSDLLLLMILFVDVGIHTFVDLWYSLLLLLSIVTLSLLLLIYWWLIVSLTVLTGRPVDPLSVTFGDRQVFGDPLSYDHSLTSCWPVLMDGDLDRWLTEVLTLIFIGIIVIVIDIQYCWLYYYCYYYYWSSIHWWWPILIVDIYSLLLTSNIHWPTVQIW